MLALPVYMGIPPLWDGGLSSAQPGSLGSKFWREKGGCLSEETIAKLRAANIPIIVEEYTAYHTDKKPVRMEYIDDINIPEFKEIPTYKRMCVCILKNDHTCKYMGFSQTKRERDMRKEVMDKYNFYKHGKLC